MDNLFSYELTVGFGYRAIIFQNSSCSFMAVLLVILW